MAKLIQQFNARNFNPEQGIGGFPIGNHLVKNVASEVKATKAGDGGYLQYTAIILDGEHAGTSGAVRFNLYSASPEAARIAHSSFSAICHVTNVLDIQDSSQLHEIPYRIEVGLQKEPNPNKYTEVKRFFDVNGNAPGQQGGNGNGQQNQSQQQSSQPADNGQQQNQGQQQAGGWGNQGGGQQNGQQGGQQPQGTTQQANGGGQWGNGTQSGGNQGNGGTWGQQPSNQGGNQGGNGGQWGNRT